MPVEGALLAYAGFAHLARATHRYRDARALSFLSQPAHRLAGAVLLILSFIMSLVRFGAAQGPVAWTGMLCLAAAAMVLLLSRWPRVAFSGALVAVPAAMLAGLS
jgi:hypothetical protein